MQQLEQKHRQAVCDIAAKDIDLEQLAAVAQQAGACREIDRLRQVLRDVQAEHHLILRELREAYQANLLSIAAKDQELPWARSRAAEQLASANMDQSKLRQALLDATAKAMQASGQVQQLMADAHSRQQASAQEGQKVQKVLQDVRTKHKESLAPVKAQDKQIAQLLSDAAHQQIDKAHEIERFQGLLRDVHLQHQKALDQLALKDDETAALKCDAAAQQKMAEEHQQGLHRALQDLRLEHQLHQQSSDQNAEMPESLRRKPLRHCVSELKRPTNRRDCSKTAGHASAAPADSFSAG